MSNTPVTDASIDAWTRALDRLRELIVEMFTAEFPDGVTVRMWPPNVENRRLPMRLEDV